MLMRLFGSSDYDRSLRRRRLMGFGLLAVGLTGIVCYFLLVDGSEALSEYARGFYLGGASGISVGSVFLIVRSHYLLTHPEARKKAKIQEQDEREKSIIAQSFQFAGIFTFYVAVASMFVLVAVSRAAARAMLAVLVVYSVSWLLANVYLSKKL